MPSLPPQGRALPLEGSLRASNPEYHSKHSCMCFSTCLSQRTLSYPHYSVNTYGCHGLHVDTGRVGMGVERCSREDRICQDQLMSTVSCPAYSHIHHQQYSHLFHQAPSSVAPFLATDQPNLLGNYLEA